MAYETQKNFAAGELSPFLWYRNDSPVRDAAVGIMKNMIAEPYGPAHSRHGFKFIEELEGETYCRIFDFDVSFSESYVVAVTQNTIYVLDRNGFSLSANYLLNPGFDDGSIWDDDRVKFNNGVAEFEPGGGGNNPAWITQQITVTNETETHIGKLNWFGNFPDTPFTVNIGTTQGDADIFTASGTGNSFTFEFIPGVTSFWFEVFIDSGEDDKWLDFASFAEEVPAGDGTVEFPSPYTEQDIRELQIDKTPGNKTMYLFTRGQTPRELVYTGVHIWSFDEITFDFGAGSAPWGSENPGCVAFYSGRMAVGGTYSQPVHIWLSKPRDYTNFDLGDVSAQEPDDALELPLDKHGALHWLRGNTRLFAGLDTGEHIIFGEGGVIAPDNAQTEQHSTYGSARIHGIVVDELIVYIDSQGRKVRGMIYSDSSGAYQSTQLSFQAEHITEGRLTEVKYGTSPFGVLYAPTLDGDLVMCNIEQDQDTIGWSRHDTQGDIISVTVLKEFGVDVPWVAVIRNDRLFIERYSIIDHVFMDSYITVVEAAPTTIFFGFDHLEGQTVQVVTDSAVHPDKVVQPNGSILLDYNATIVSAGLGFNTVIETLPVLNDTDKGNTLNFFKHFAKVFVSIITSAKPIINGEDTYRRFATTSMGEPEPFVTEIVEVGNLGWNRTEIIRVEQSLPVPLTVAAVGGKVKENKL